MRLIEKECPNCGAGLHFNKEDTTCKCEYCKREFEIERDTEKKKISDQYILNELKNPFNIFSYFTFGRVISQAIGGMISMGIIMFITFIIIIILGFNIITSINDSNSIFNRNAALVTSTKQLHRSDYSTIDIQSNILISNETRGTTGTYSAKGDYKRKRLYIIYNDKSNLIVAIYKATYVNLFDSNDKHTVYIPITYKNVKTKNNSISYSLDEGEISASEYYFNDNNYTYGFDDLSTLCIELVKKYENDYKIVKK